MKKILFIVLALLSVNCFGDTFVNQRPRPRIDTNFYMPQSQSLAFWYRFDTPWGQNSVSNPPKRYWDFAPKQSNYFNITNEYYVSSTNGYSGYVYSDGTNTTGIIGDRSYVNGCTSVTFSAWIKANMTNLPAASSGYGGMFYAPLAPTYFGLFWQDTVQPEHWEFYYTRSDSGGLKTWPIYVTMPLEPPSWNNIVLVSQPYLNQLYVNGYLLAFQTNAYAGPITSLTSMAFAFAKDLTSRKCSLSLDEVAMWTNVVLSSNEIVSMYNTQRSNIAYTVCASNWIYKYTFDNWADTNEYFGNTLTNSYGDILNRSNFWDGRGIIYIPTNAERGLRTGNINPIPVSDKWCIGVWVYPLYTKSAYHTICGNPRTFELAIRSEDNKLTLYSVNLTNQTLIISSPSVVNYSNWYHCVGVYNSTNLLLYTNGVLCATGGIKNVIGLNDFFSIGNDQRITFDNFSASGYYDDIFLMGDNYLTSNEVWELYSARSNEYNSSWVSNAVVVYPYTNSMSALYTFENGPNGQPTNELGEYWDFSPVGTNFLKVSITNIYQPSLVDMSTNGNSTVMYFKGTNLAYFGQTNMLDKMSNITISYWCKLDDYYQRTFAAFLSIEGVGLNQSYKSYVDLNVVRNLGTYHNGIAYAPYLPFMSPGRWHHYVYSFNTNSKAVKILQDGIVVLSFTNNTAISQRDQVNIGADYSDVTGRSIIGYMDDIAVWTNWAADFNDMSNMYYNSIGRYNQPLIATNLVCYFNFDSNTNSNGRFIDSSGNNVTATNIGSFWVDGGAYGGCITQGTGGVWIDTTMAYENEKNVTIGAWINRRSSIAYGYFLIEDFINGNNNSSLGFNAAGTAISITFWPSVGGTVRVVDTTNIVNTGVWYHVSAVYKLKPVGINSIIDIYVNGRYTASATSSIPSRAFTWGNGMQIGCGRFGSGRRFDGAIDDVFIFREAISSNDIFNLYNSTTNIHNLSWNPL